MIPSNIGLLLSIKHEKIGKIDQAGNLCALRYFVASKAKTRIEDFVLLEALSRNLSKNSRELRLETLKVQLGLFEQLDYLEFNENNSRNKMDIDTVK